MCQTHTMCTVLYMCCLIEFSQQTALGRLFNYCHFADGVIGLQRGDTACLETHGWGFKAPCLLCTSLKPAVPRPQRPQGPSRPFQHFEDLRLAQKVMRLHSPVEVVPRVGVGSLSAHLNASLPSCHSSCGLWVELGLV